MRFIKLLSITLLVIVLGVVSFVYFAPVQATRIALDADRQHSGLVRKEIVLPDGMHYVYLEGGKGEALMLLHGFGANKDNFTRVAHWLTPHYRVIVPDLLGFGESSHPADADYTSRAQAKRLRGLVQALGIKTLHLGGNSMGGQIAMAYAALHPNEVTSLWLLDPAGIWSAPKSELEKIIRSQGRNPLIAKNEDEFAYIFSFVMSNPPFIPKPMLNVMALGQINNVILSERIFNQIVADSVEQSVTGLTTPTLIVWGDQDRVINVATAEILHKLMPRSQLAIMTGAGHLPMLERPRQSAAEYLHFRGQLHGGE
ncbi:MAG: alpha/beta hydrolase [Undibacterium sp.]|uniref:alpha/beta fold hydrolase n=1 Tax=Undibacterium sp. TaxID=1914977 RepID=UPI00271CB693|nr:alpha/beta hydrolase [Undibacterium sp.]MDO8650604.1 alpha/beta hydrolase [Undibacterium sp.]